MAEYPLVLAGGRVIDPESGLDAVRDVGIAGYTVVEVADRALSGSVRLDVSGLVVCPGFVDLHSHGQAIAEQRLQALDGVTTALELEAGTVPVEQAYARYVTRVAPYLGTEGMQPMVDDFSIEIGCRYNSPRVALEPGAEHSLH